MYITPEEQKTIADKLLNIRESKKVDINPDDVSVGDELIMANGKVTMTVTKVGDKGFQGYQMYKGKKKKISMQKSMLSNSHYKDDIKHVVKESFGFDEYLNENTERYNLNKNAVAEKWDVKIRKNVVIKTRRASLTIKKGSRGSLIMVLTRTLSDRDSIEGKFEIISPEDVDKHFDNVNRLFDQIK